MNERSERDSPVVEANHFARRGLYLAHEDVLKAWRWQGRGGIVERVEERWVVSDDGGE
tara:strand:- start:1015 stop:1188 length:174 start_codon:yes stop_codon:yes gene_type:complete